MADDPRRALLVQKMVGEGTSDEDIRATLKAFDANAQPAQPPPVSAADLLSGAVGADPGTPDGTPAPLGRWDQMKADIVGNPILRGMAHPQSLGDLAPMLLPTGVGSALRAVGPSLSSLGQGVEKVGGVMARPARYVGAWEMLTNPLKGAVTMAAPEAAGMLGRGLQRAGEALTPAERVAAAAPDVSAATADATGAAPAMSAPAPAASGLTPTDLANLKAKGYPPALIQKIAQRAAGTPDTAYPGLTQIRSSELQGRFGGTQAAAQPVSMGDLTPIPNTAEVPFSQPPMAVSHPLTTPRFNLGADAVAAQQGLSPDAVRAATGPLHGEVPGTASPLVPNDPMNTVIGKMASMDPADLSEYVNRTRSPKNRAQFEVIMRTLQHPGVVSASSRESLLQALAALGPVPK